MNMPISRGSVRSFLCQPPFDIRLHTNENTRFVCKSQHFSTKNSANCRNSRIALAPAFAQHPPMLARVLSAAANGIEAFPVEVEVNSGWGDAGVAMMMSISPVANSPSVA
jgi:hypothetical protein